MPGGMQSKSGRNEIYMQHKRMSTQCHYATAADLSRSKTSDWECPRFQHNQTRQRQKDGTFCGQKRPTESQLTAFWHAKDGIFHPQRPSLNMSKAVFAHRNDGLYRLQRPFLPQAQAVAIAQFRLASA